MKPAILTLILAAGLTRTAAAATDRSDPARVLNDLVQANKAKDINRMASALKGVGEIARTGTEPAVADSLARELSRSLKVFAGNLGTQREIVDALGALRSKKGTAALKRLAFRKRVKKDHEAALQARAIEALALMRDPKLIGGFEDQAKNRNMAVAKAAYAGFASYAESKARVRKRITELLVKRLELEYPAYSNSNGKWISDEKRKRWRAVAQPIVRSLQAVTRQSTIQNVEDWREWWKENKRKPWRDAPEG